MPSNKELLEQVLAGQAKADLRHARFEEKQRETAKKVAQTAMDLSSFMNEQTKHNVKIEGYIYNDGATGQPGLVKQMADIGKKVIAIDKKLAIFSIGAAALIYIIKFLIGKVAIFAKLVA